jgi:hypothetical protein
MAAYQKQLDEEQAAREDRGLFFENNLTRSQPLESERRLSRTTRSSI